MLAAQDEPLGAVRRQTVAVLFADIVGFTRMAEGMAPEAVVTMLREFHKRMTAQIFTCGGTVDKYIGDEIFAVFGVPTASDMDAANALRCADMSFTVIGDTVNTAARLQGLTRTLETPLVVGEPLVNAARASERAAALVSQLQEQGEQPLRGRAAAVRIWTRGEGG